MTITLRFSYLAFSSLSKTLCWTFHLLDVSVLPRTVSPVVVAASWAGFKVYRKMVVLRLMGRLHAQANVQQTYSKCITRANAGRLLDRVNILKWKEEEYEGAGREGERSRRSVLMRGRILQCLGHSLQAKARPRPC